MTTITHLLDTDIASLAEAGWAAVNARLGAAPAGTVGIPVITVEERVAGWYDLLRKVTKPVPLEAAYRGLAGTVGFLGRFPILPYTVTAMAEFDKLLALKLNVKKNDLRIAAIAMEAQAVVVTRNVRDFARVPGLAIEDWSAPPGP